MRTQEKLDTILSTLQGNCGDEFAACRAAGISLLFLKQWMRDDADVAKQVSEAKTCGYMGLESEAIRRAVLGTKKGIYYQGEEIAQETVYSDGLLTKLLTAKLPEYAKGEGGPGTAIQINGGQVNIMPRAASYDEWLAMKDSTIAHAALPAPVPSLMDDSELAEFTEVMAEMPFANLGL